MEKLEQSDSGEKEGGVGKFL